jgi:hypothetical protein
MAAAAAFLVVLSWTARADLAKDRAMCADKLMGLATCLTFVQDKATARAPTPDCCAGLKQVVAASKMCMCVLVKDRDEPALGFEINVTRAMDLPSLCSNPATFSDCPSTYNGTPSCAVLCSCGSCTAPTRTPCTHHVPRGARRQKLSRSSRPAVCVHSSLQPF